MVWVERAEQWRTTYRICQDQPSTVAVPVPDWSHLQIYRPGRLLPAVYRPRLERWLEESRLKQAVNLLETQGCKQIVLYLWLPEFDRVLDVVEHEVSCYHIDDEFTLKASTSEPVVDGTGRSMVDREVDLLRRVDQVFIHSPALMEKKGHINSNTLYVTNGVDFAAFSTPTDEPSDISDIPHPRIGYLGVIKNRLNVPLLTELAQQHPHWSFVYVGPESPMGSFEQDYRALKGLPNTYFLGGKPATGLPAYAQSFDVSTMCYVMNEYTRCIYPLKLHEYLATGKPVVGTPIRGLEDHSNVVRLASTCEEWSQAINASLSPEESTPKRIRERMEVAGRHDWDYLTGLVAGAICQRLNRDRSRLAEVYGEPELNSPSY